ncbi:MAG: S8 family serine peptidase, partial [Actinoallomurus sp.]
MRGVPRRLRAVTSVAAATATLLISALPGAAAAEPTPVGLPVIPSALASGQHCTGASPTQAHAQPWTVRALSLSRVRQLSQGAGITVAVVDTGVGSGVSALAGRVTAASGAGQDCVGHGTFVAGLIAGRADEATGGGVAPQARVLAVRGTGPRGDTKPGTVAAAIRSAVDHGARVVYVAAALTTGRDELTAAVAYATGKDALVVA